MEGARSWGRGNGVLLCHGDGASAGEDGKVLAMVVMAA